MKVPIVVFVYKRLEETKMTIQALKENEMSKDSNLIIFSDSHKEFKDKKEVLKVREYLKTITGFKSIEIFESNQNKGLAQSIIDGVSQVFEKYEKAIILEDDLLVSSDFLKYMNETLDFYKNDTRIWSISGYMPELNMKNISKKNVYLIPRACSWGWGTWKDRWEKNDWEIKNYEKEKKIKIFKNLFNIGGNDLFLSLRKQVEFKGKSWAIRWCYNQTKNGMYTIYPFKSKVKNIGFGENATHSYKGEEKKWLVSINSDLIKLEKNIVLDFEVIDTFNKKHSITLRSYIGFLLRKLKIYKKN